jgi:hypothetical protein
MAMTLKQEIDQAFDTLEQSLRGSSLTTTEEAEASMHLQARYEQLSHVLGETTAAHSPPRAQVVQTAARMLGRLLDELEQEHAIQDSYGYPRDADPRLFTPDPDTTPPECLAAHAAAVASANAGEPIPDLPDAWTFIPKGAQVLPDKNAMPSGLYREGVPNVSLHIPAATVVHSHFGGWGMGISTWHDEELLELIGRMRSALSTVSSDLRELAWYRDNVHPPPCTLCGGRTAWSMERPHKKRWGCITQCGTKKAQDE